MESCHRIFATPVHLPAESGRGASADVRERFRVHLRDRPVGHPGRTSLQVDSRATALSNGINAPRHAPPRDSRSSRSAPRASAVCSHETTAKDSGLDQLHGLSSWLRGTGSRAPAGGLRARGGEPRRRDRRLQRTQQPRAHARRHERPATSLRSTCSPRCCSSPGLRTRGGGARATRRRSPPSSGCEDQLAQQAFMLLYGRTHFDAAPLPPPHGREHARVSSRSTAGPAARATTSSMICGEQPRDRRIGRRRSRTRSPRSHLTPASRACPHGTQLPRLDPRGSTSRAHPNPAAPEAREGPRSRPTSCSASAASTSADPDRYTSSR